MRILPYFSWYLFVLREFKGKIFYVRLSEANLNVNPVLFSVHQFLKEEDSAAIVERIDSSSVNKMYTQTFPFHTDCFCSVFPKISPLKIKLKPSEKSKKCGSQKRVVGDCFAFHNKQIVVHHGK